MKQIRFIPNTDCGLQVREPQEGQAESRTVLGKPIVFGVRSRNITPWSTTRKVYEVLEPGCISQELLLRSDVVMNLNHSNKVTDILGRYRNSQNDTLKLTLRMNGVDSDCNFPETNAANDTLVLIKRGDISGMSFAFEDDYEDTENGVSYERTNEMEDGKEVWIRHVKRITAIYDVAIVTHPAYDQTTVTTREESDAIDHAIEAQIQRECGGGKEDAEAKKKKEAEEAAKREAEAAAKREAEEAAKREAEEAAKREAEAAAKREAEEAAKREAEAAAKAEAEANAKEERELEEQAQMFREQRRLRMRQRAHLNREEDIDNFFV